MSDIQVGLACACPALARLYEPVITSRILVVAAHPDDETIGAGAALAKSVDAHVVVVTDGAPRDRSFWPAALRGQTRESYARLRCEELCAALGEVGLDSRHVHLLDIVDNEAIDSIEMIIARLVPILKDIKPDVVLTHAYEGGHVDHDATSLAVHAAMARTGCGHPHEMALYHGSGGKLVVHDFLPGGPPTRTLALDARLRSLKSRMLGQHQSQRQHDVYFGVEFERYRCAPAYDFRHSPDPLWPLLYERSGTPVTGEQWRERACTAMKELNALERPVYHSPNPAGSPQTLQVATTASIRGTTGEEFPRRVSVIVRTTGRDTLSDTLRSIAAQTYPSLEVVIVDAVGRDSDSSWLEREGLVVRRCGGRELARSNAANVGLDASTGDFIVFLDDDDWFHPNHVASLVEAIGATPDVRVAYGGVEVVEWPDEGRPVQRKIFASPYDPVALICENYIPINAVLFARSLLDEGCRFDEALLFFEDWDFWIQLSSRTGFRHVPGIGAAYRWPPGSGVNDSRRTVAAQEQIFRKWHGALSAENHIALLRRVNEQNALNDALKTQLQTKQEHLHAQDEELGRLHSSVSEQERQLEQLRRHVRAQDEELARLRPCVGAQEAQLAAFRNHLNIQDQELARLRPCVVKQETQLAALRKHLKSQHEELVRLRPCVGEQEAQLAALRKHLNVQDEELARLRPCVGAQEAQLAAFRNHLDVQDEELARLRPCVGAQEAQLAAFRNHLNIQDQELARLRPCVEKQETQLAALRKHLKSQHEELVRLRPCVGEQEAQLAALRKHLNVQDEELARLRPCVGAQEAQLATLREHLNAQNEELARLRPWVGAQEAQLAAFRKHLNVQDEELTRLRPCVEAQEAQLAAFRNHLDVQDEELARLRPCVGAQEAQLAELRKHLNVQDEELALLRSIVSDQRSQIEPSAEEAEREPVAGLETR